MMMIKCESCARCHRQNEQLYCDAGVFDIRIIGKVDMALISQDKCDHAKITETKEPKPIAQVQKRIGRPPKNGR